MVGQPVKWWKPDRFKDIIHRPGAMHIIMSFLGCIGTLMKGSGPDTFVGSAFGGLTGVERWKPWGHSVWYPLHDWSIFCRTWPMRTILMISWHTLKMGGNTHQEGTGWITFWCQRSWLISFFGQREREENWLFHNCALNVCYYTSSVWVTSIMLAISPGTCWRCGNFYLTLPDHHSDALICIYDALICIYENEIFNLELNKFVHCDPGPWQNGCRCHFCDFTIHNKKVIEEIMIFDNGL